MTSRTSSSFVPRSGRRRLSPLPHVAHASVRPPTSLSPMPVVPFIHCSYLCQSTLIRVQGAHGIAPSAD